MNYLQLNDTTKFEKEEAALARHFGEGNYTPFYKKQVIQGKLKITKNDFIAGEIQVIFAAMKQLGIGYSYNDYPESLQKYLHRKIWTSTMRDIRDEIFEKGYLENPTFIKPKDRLKRFTGFVCDTVDDLYRCNNAGNNVKIWCSKPVQFLSEYRCPIINGELRGLFTDNMMKSHNGPYPNKKIINEMILDYKDSPKAYCLDVGVLSSGETALIEVNDAFSIGKYNMPDELYAELVITRWCELKSSAK